MTRAASYLSEGIGRRINRVSPKKLKYRNNPVGYLRDVLNTELWGGMQKVANALASKPDARIAVRTGHGIGKTFTVARLALWFYDCYRPSKVITTAPTGRQVEKLLWAEIGTAFRQARIIDPAYPGRILTTSIKTDDPSWFMFGFSADDPAAAEGFHSENLLVIIDEAKGVDEDIYTALEGAMGGVNARMMRVSTPGEPIGPFYDSFSSSLYRKFHYSVWDMIKWYEKRNIPIPKGCSTRKWAEERLEEWGEDSIRYKMRIMGEFCQSVAEAVIPFEWVERAMDTERPKTIVGEKVLGIDIAEFGDEKTVFFIGDDAGCVHLEWLDKSEITETAGKAIQIINKYGIKPRNVTIDSTGLGTGVGSILRSKGLEEVQCIHFAERSSDSDEWANIITEIYWGLRRRLSEDGFYLPKNDDLKEDLIKRKFKTNSDGAYEIEKKDKYRKRVGRSPDFGDAAALAYYRRPSPLLVLGAVY